MRQAITNAYKLLNITVISLLTDENYLSVLATITAYSKTQDAQLCRS